MPRLSRPNFGFGGAWFALGKQELHLIVDAARRGNEAASTHFALHVADAQVARDYLLSQNVREVSILVSRPDGATQVFFADPDGHRLEMVSYPDLSGASE